VVLVSCPNIGEPASKEIPPTNSRSRRLIFIPTRLQYFSSKISFRLHVEFPEPNQADGKFLQTKHGDKFDAATPVTFNFAMAREYVRMRLQETFLW